MAHVSRSTIQSSAGARAWVREEVFEGLAAAYGPPAERLLASTPVKTHRCAGGGKGGRHDQAIGTGRGGRITEIFTPPDGLRRSVVFSFSRGAAAGSANLRLWSWRIAGTTPTCDTLADILPALPTLRPPSATG